MNPNLSDWLLIGFIVIPILIAYFFSIFYGQKLIINTSVPLKKRIIWGVVIIFFPILGYSIYWYLNMRQNHS